MAAASVSDYQLHTEGDALRVSVQINRNGSAKKGALSLGWQLFDPATSTFIREGEWEPVRDDAAGIAGDLTIQFPPEPGGYRVYISPIRESEGWSYARGGRFLIVDLDITAAGARVLFSGLTTLRALRTRAVLRAVPQSLIAPVRAVTRNSGLIRSMVRRDILSRYRGSFGDAFWTVLNPLLLMGTYFFVFGVVLRTRFAGDSSSSGFALYFLAGMLPWLAFSEAVGRAPNIILEHRNFVKKLIFPLETLPVNAMAAGLVTEFFALIIYVCGLLVLRGGIPATALWLPLIIIPQILFTVGLCWFLAATGVYVRDLIQVMTFVLTLWFFLTPICYPETSLPQSAFFLLRKNPMFVVVRAYRSVFLEHHAPAALPLLKFWILAILTCIGGYAWFHKLRKSFADVL